MSHVELIIHNPLWQLHVVGDHVVKIEWLYAEINTNLPGYAGQSLTNKGFLKTHTGTDIC